MDETSQALSLPNRVKLYAEGSLATDPKVRQGFIDRFAEVWRALPTEDREAIERYIEASNGQLEVQLRDHHHNLTRGPSGGAPAQYIHGLGTDEVIYKCNIAKNLTYAACRHWIAHEIAHLFLHIRDNTHGNVYTVAEREVAELLDRRWGYSTESESNLEVEIYFINAGKQIDGRLVV